MADSVAMSGVEYASAKSMITRSGLLYLKRLPRSLALWRLSLILTEADLTLEPRPSYLGPERIGSCKGVSRKQIRTGGGGRGGVST